MTSEGGNPSPGNAVQVDEVSYRALLTAAGIGISETDADGTFVYANERYCELVGRRRDELIGRMTFMDITYPDDVTSNLTLANATIRTGSPFSMEKRYLRPDGTVIWVNIFASWVPGTADAGGRLIAGSVDITERKQAEQAIRESEERKSFLLRLGDRLRSLADPIEVMDSAAEMLGTYLSVNRVSYGELSVDGLVLCGRDWVRGVASLPPRFHLAEWAPAVLQHFFQNQTSISYDVYREPGLTDTIRGVWKELSVRAHVSVPLQKNGRLVAALGVHCAQPRRWTDAEIALIEETAERTWSAVEQARAEKALRTSEGHLAAIFAQAAVGLSEISLDGRFIHVNDETCRLVGRERHKLLGMSIAEVSHPRDVSASYAAIQHLIETGIPTSIDKCYVRPDGSQVFANSTLTRLDDQTGQPRAILAVSVDLTERKRAEAALAEELADNRRLQEVSTRLIPADSAQQLFEELVAAAVEITRGDQGTIQLLDRQTNQLDLLVAHGVDDVDLDKFSSVTTEAATSCAEAMREKHRVVVSDYGSDPKLGGTDTARAHISLGIKAAQSTPLISRSGNLLGMISTYWRQPCEPEERQLRLLDVLARQAADLIERHQSEEALRRSEERFRTLFNSLDAGFCVLEVYFDDQGQTLDYSVIEANPAFERHTGLVGAIGKSIRQIAPNLEQHWFDVYGHIALTGEAQRFVQQAQGLGGQWFDVYAFRIGEPRDHRVAVLFTDISDRIRTEEELKEADRRKNEFLAMLAHELRNPLAPIRTGLEVLRISQGQQETTEHMLGLMERQMQQMVRLVDDLLDLARITQGKVKVQRERCVLQDVLESALEGSRPLIGGSGVELSVSLPSERVEIHADPARLAQVVSNLLNNAAKYTEPGGRVWLVARINGSDVSISVRDTGTGIPAHMLNSIFDAFTQVDHTLGRSHGGLGVGLSLVQTLVELHGGTVRAESAGLGKGSEFNVRLPDIVCGHGIAEAPRAEPERPLPSFRVLVVDDNTDAADALCTILSIMGNEVRTANNGREGLALADEFRPHLVLLDLGMPEMDGYEAARQLRSHSWGKSTFISALTGWGQEEDRKRSQEAGFDYHLVKPVSQEALQTLLRKLEQTRRT